MFIAGAMNTLDILWLAGVLAISTAQARTWTSSDGKEIDAEYVSSNNDSVVLRMTDGKEYTVPFERLSESDVEYAKEKAKEQAEEKTEVSEVQLKRTANWDDDWPEIVRFEDRDVEINIEEEKEEEKVFVYDSPNYRFTSDVRLSKSVVSTFVDTFEATLLYVRELPLGVDGGNRRNGKFDIFLFENREDYHKAGGRPGTAGVFIGGKKGRVLVPLASIGVQKVGSGYMRNHKKTNKTLIHELTHQLTPNAYYQSGLGGWFSEGLADYVGSTPFRGGAFNVRRYKRSVIEYVTAYGRKNTGGRALGKNITVPYITDFMGMPYSKFTGANSRRNYGFSLLLVSYFFHIDGDGDAANIKKMLQRAQEGKVKNKEELWKILCNGRSYEELQEDIVKGLRSQGVKITFLPKQSE